MRIATLVKQVPRFEAMELGDDGRLKRDGLELEMNPYCRRAVSKGIELARGSGGSCTALALGPEVAEDVLREAVACGADEGVLICDPQFAGSDTLATARALAAALRAEGPFDLILTGRNSVDADTGQVGPAVAQLLDLPFVSGVRELELTDGELRVRCEHDDGWLTATVTLPAVISVAERLCEPAKAPAELRASVPATRIRTVTAAQLGEGPWGVLGSPTRVGEVKAVDRVRNGVRFTGSIAEQVRAAITTLIARGALTHSEETTLASVVAADDRGGPPIVVVVEPGRSRETAELLGAAASLARGLGGRVVAFGAPADRGAELRRSGADDLVGWSGEVVAEDVAAGLITWAGTTQPWAVLVLSTAWGREVASRTAADLGAGLTGDAVALEERDGRLIAWKPAFGGAIVAAIEASSAVQMVTVRPGVLPLLRPREVPPAGEVAMQNIAIKARGRVLITRSERDDDLEVLASAVTVIGVGGGVPQDEYPALERIRALLGAEFGATRKVTDRGWLPRSRQLGITGRSIAPRLYVSVGINGKFNHLVGVRAAGTILAINSDPNAPVFAASDLGIVGDWREVLPCLVDQLSAAGIRPADPTSS